MLRTIGIELDYIVYVDIDLYSSIQYCAAYVVKNVTGNFFEREIDLFVRGSV